MKHSVTVTLTNGKTATYPADEYVGCLLLKKDNGTMNYPLENVEKLTIEQVEEQT